MHKKIYADNKQKYYCLDPYSKNLQTNCITHPILGTFNSLEQCAMSCPSQKSKLWDMVTAFHKRLHSSIEDKQYNEGFVRLKSFANVVQKLATKNKISLLDQFINSYDARRYTYMQENYDVVDEIISNDNLFRINTQCVSIAILFYLILDILGELNDNYRLIAMTGHVTIQEHTGKRDGANQKIYETKELHNYYGVSTDAPYDQAGSDDPVNNILFLMQSFGKWHVYYVGHTIMDIYLTYMIEMQQHAKYDLAILFDEILKYRFDTIFNPTFKFGLSMMYGHESLYKNNNTTIGIRNLNEYEHIIEIFDNVTKNERLFYFTPSHYEYMLVLIRSGLMNNEMLRGAQKYELEHYVGMLEYLRTKKIYDKWMENGSIICVMRCYDEDENYCDEINDIAHSDERYSDDEDRYDNYDNYDNWIGGTKRKRKRKSKSGKMVDCKQIKMLRMVPPSYYTTDIENIKLDPIGNVIPSTLITLTNIFKDGYTYHAAIYDNDKLIYC